MDVLRSNVPDASVFDNGASAVPYVPSSATLAPDRQSSFNERFGNSPSSSAGAPQTDRSQVRVLSSRVLAPDGSPFQSTVPSQVRQQPDRPLGIVTGQPMPDYPVPPSVFGLPDQSAATGDNMDDWLAGWIKSIGR
jgi:hypothetical protein